MWKATTLDEGIKLAEEEAVEYAETVGVEFIEFSQAYLLADDPRDSGAEVFSLIRDSDLPPKEYAARYFSTGAEREQHWEAPPDDVEANEDERDYWYVAVLQSDGGYSDSGQIRNWVNDLNAALSVIVSGAASDADHWVAEAGMRGVPFLHIHGSGNSDNALSQTIKLMAELADDLVVFRDPSGDNEDLDAACQFARQAGLRVTVYVPRPPEKRNAPPR